MENCEDDKGLMIGLRLAAFFRLQAQRGVSALTAPGGLYGITGIATQAYLLVK
jgi:hypothetical protein